MIKLLNLEQAITESRLRLEGGTIRLYMNENVTFAIKTT